jgi:hypothetical protein
VTELTIIIAFSLANLILIAFSNGDKDDADDVDDDDEEDDDEDDDDDAAILLLFVFNFFVCS